MADPVLIRCLSCGATNRVPLARMTAGQQPVCGKCKSPLPLDGTVSDHPIEVTDATFAKDVEESPIPVLVDLWAPWCGPCRMITPVIEQLAKEMAGRVRFAKVNIDDNPRTASRFGIQSIPALLVMKNGREVDRMIGVQPKSEIVRRLNALAS